MTVWNQAGRSSLHRNCANDDTIHYTVHSTLIPKKSRIATIYQNNLTVLTPSRKIVLSLFQRHLLSAPRRISRTCLRRTTDQLLFPGARPHTDLQALPNQHLRRHAWSRGWCDTCEGNWLTPTDCELLALTHMVSGVQCQANRR